jgi:CNT family concentrative nucleoside transporter
MQNLQSLLGIFALLAIAWTLSEDRRAVAWRQAGIGLLATVATAVVMLKLPGATRAWRDQ